MMISARRRRLAQAMPIGALHPGYDTNRRLQEARAMEVQELREEAAVVTPPRVDRDWPIVEALRRGDPTAAERLVAAYGSLAYRLALRITGSTSDAEEAVQDALWSVVRKIDTFRGDSGFGSWLYRIVANAAFGRRRHGNSRRLDCSLDEVAPVLDEHGRPAVADWSAQAEDPSIRSELQLVLATAVDELPPGYRAVIVLRDIQGLSHREVGEILRIPVSTSKSRVHRAHLVLRERLTGYMSAEYSAGAGK
jgi:RNA polymerase sigma-70 factor (ECF subfamily)